MQPLPTFGGQPVNQIVCWVTSCKEPKVITRTLLPLCVNGAVVTPWFDAFCVRKEVKPRE